MLAERLDACRKELMNTSHALRGGTGKISSVILGHLIYSGHYIDRTTTIYIIYREPHNAPKVVRLRELEATEAVFNEL